MSTYYEYQDVGVMMAHKLMKMDGWKVYGYHADNSDAMTDYYDPAYWNGIATKNGYTLVVNQSSESKPQEICKYNYDGMALDMNIADKIQKLEQMTVERGASEQEEESAKAMIQKLREKQNTSSESYIVTGIIPGHMANPPRMNWHIEKDGVYIAKGNGILKYAKVDDYYRYSHCEEEIKKFRTIDREKFKEDYVVNLMGRWNTPRENAEKIADSHIEDMQKDMEMIDKFEEFIRKIDSLCGGMIGEGDGVIYEKVKVTEYKKENKVVEDTEGSIKDGQCFVVKTSFNYGHHKGYVYRIHVTEYEDGKKLYHAYKLNGKLTKECTGMANQSNYWYITDNFTRWFDKGSLAWCHIEEVKTPYEVEKVVKKVLNENKKETKKETAKTETTPENTQVGEYTYEVSEDVDTIDNSKIYLVKVVKKLDREEYIKVNNYMKSIGGYYSRFKHAFLFKENPSDKLNGTVKESEQPEQEETQTETVEQKTEITYTVTEEVHTQNGSKIWVVTPDKKLSKADFTTVKQKFATKKGFYSGFKKGFIFKYDPTEMLQTV